MQSCFSNLSRVWFQVKWTFGHKRQTAARAVLIRPATSVRAAFHPEDAAAALRRRIDAPNAAWSNTALTVSSIVMLRELCSLIH